MTEFDETKAKQRFMILNVVRLAGIALVLIAIAFSQMAPNIPSIFNVLLSFAGLALFFFWPRKLASQWKSEDE